MRDFLILTKALYKANYGMDLKSKQGRKGIIAMVVLVVCLLPTFALIFNMFLEGFRLHSFDLMIMEMGFACLCFLMLWTALFVFPSVFYFSNDLEHLLVLPISGKTIVASKFVIVYISLMLVACIGMLPILVAYIMAGNASISSILFYIPQIFLIGLPTTLIVCIFWMILMRLLPFFKNKDRFNMITGVLSIGLAIVIGLASIVIGEVIFGHKGAFGTRLTSIVVGSVIYRVIVAVVLQMGLNTDDLKLLTAILVAVALTVPIVMNKQKQLSMYKKLTGREQ